MQSNPNDFPNHTTAEGVITNPLLKELLPTVDQTNQYRVVQTRNSAISTTPVQQHILQVCLSDMLNDESVSVSNFAKDLIRYCLVLSNDNKTPKLFPQLIPASYKIETGYSDVI
ncbi:MAG: hypothetical protein EOM41_08190 [Bacilli bacterium]|nr:hypothetical protein [Bacilli bacterium]